MLCSFVRCGGEARCVMTEPMSLGNSSDTLNLVYECKILKSCKKRQPAELPSSGPSERERGLRVWIHRGGWDAGPLKMLAQGRSLPRGCAACAWHVMIGRAPAAWGRDRPHVCSLLRSCLCAFTCRIPQPSISG